jgi:IS30 family transposase
MFSKGRRDQSIKPRHRIKVGSDMPQAVLRESDIPLIRAAHAAGESLRSIGRRYGVHPSTIRHAVVRESWKHVS